MKIIYSDNIPDDETLLMGNVEKKWGQRVCDKLNEKRLGDYQGPFYRLVEDNHKLYKWENHKNG